MGKILLKDFSDQKRNIIGILMIAVIGAAIGFAFQMIYICVGIILTAGFSIVYMNCFFEYHTVDAVTEKQDDERIMKVLREKLKVRTKYVEIILIAVFLYILMTIAFFVNAFDTGVFNNPDFTFLDSLEQIAISPVLFIFATIVLTPFLVTIKPNKVLFVIFALFSISVPFGIYVLDLFFEITEMQRFIISMPLTVIGLALISYFISLRIVMRRS